MIIITLTTGVSVFYAMYYALHALSCYHFHYSRFVEEKIKAQRD